MYIWPLRLLNALTPGQLYRHWEANLLTDMRYTCILSSSFSVLLSDLKKMTLMLNLCRKQVTMPTTLTTTWPPSNFHSTCCFWIMTGVKVGFFTNIKSYLYPWFLGFNGKCSLDPDASSSSLHSVSWNANYLNRKAQVSLHGSRRSEVKYSCWK